MKHLFFLLLLLVSLSSYAQKRQESSDSINNVERELLAEKIGESTIGRYKLYPTQNMWTFIKLDTYNGNLYLVQWNTDDNKRFTYELDKFWNLMNAIRLIDDDKKYVPFRNGRFSLTQTTNIHTFLLLDEVVGKVYQVQWTTDDNNCVIEIK